MPKHTHGLTNTRPYQIWYNMKERCNNENCPAYESYGNRGIKVCKEWSNSFESFLGWAMLNGYRSDLTLDRIDNDKGYEPSNCRWVTQHIQALNRRMSKKNTSGYVGITKVTTKQGKKRWAAQITINYKSKVLCAYVAMHIRGSRTTSWYPDDEQNGLESPTIVGDSPVREVRRGLVVS